MQYGGRCIDTTLLITLRLGACVLGVSVYIYTWNWMSVVWDRKCKMLRGTKKGLHVKWHQNCQTWNITQPPPLSCRYFEEQQRTTLRHGYIVKYHKVIHGCTIPANVISAPTLEDFKLHPKTVNKMFLSDFQHNFGSLQVPSKTVNKMFLSDFTCLSEPTGTNVLRLFTVGLCQSRPCT